MNRIRVALGVGSALLAGLGIALSFRGTGASRVDEHSQRVDEADHSRERDDIVPEAKHAFPRTRSADEDASTPIDASVPISTLVEQIRDAIRRDDRVTSNALIDDLEGVPFVQFDEVLRCTIAEVIRPGNPDVGAVLAKAVGSIGRKDSVQARASVYAALPTVRAATPDEGFDARVLAFMSCLQFLVTAPEQLEPAIALVDDRAEDFAVTRRRVIDIFGRLRVTQAGPRLMNVVVDSTERQLDRNAAARALVLLGESTSLWTILQQARSANGRDAKVALLQTLGRFQDYTLAYSLIREGVTRDPELSSTDALGPIMELVRWHGKRSAAEIAPFLLKQAQVDSANSPGFAMHVFQCMALGGSPTMIAYLRTSEARQQLFAAAFPEFVNSGAELTVTSAHCGAAVAWTLTATDPAEVLSTWDRLGGMADKRWACVCMNVYRVDRGISDGERRAKFRSEVTGRLRAAILPSAPISARLGALNAIGMMKLVDLSPELVKLSEDEAETEGVRTEARQALERLRQSLGQGR